MENKILRAQETKDPEENEGSTEETKNESLQRLYNDIRDRNAPLKNILKAMLSIERKSQKEKQRSQIASSLQGDSKLEKENCK